MKANLIAKEKGDAKITIAFTSEEFEQAQIDTYKKENVQFAITVEGRSTRRVLGTYLGDDRLISYLSKIDYNYDQKYFGSLSWRRDGSSRLSSDTSGTFGITGAC